MAKLKAAVRTIGDHKQRITVNVSLEGIKIIDEKTEVSASCFFSEMCWCNNLFTVFENNSKFHLLDFQSRFFVKCIVLMRS